MLLLVVVVLVVVVVVALLQGKTTILIAHRLATVVNADTIIVMKNGQVLRTT